MYRLDRRRRLKMAPEAIRQKYVQPYDLRHAFDLFAWGKVGDWLSLQRIMGHTDLAMTKRYVADTLGDIKEQHALPRLSTSLCRWGRGSGE